MRFTLALLLVAWLPLAIALALQYGVLEHKLGGYAERELVKLAEVQKRRIERELGRYVNDLALISSRTQLRISLDAFNRSGEREHQAFVERILDDAAGAVRHLKGAWIFGLEGQPVASAGVASEWPEDDVFAWLPERDGIRFGPYWSGVECERMLWIGSELTLDDRPVGRLLLALGVTGLLELLADFPDPDLIGQSYAMLQSVDGNLCMLSGATAEGVARRYFVPGDEAKSIFFAERIPLEDSSTHLVSEDGSRWMLVALVDDFGYLIVHANAGIRGELRTLVYAAFSFIAVFVLVLAALFSAWVARRIAAPVYAMVDAVAAVRDGRGLQQPDDRGWPWEFRILMAELVSTFKSQRRFVSALRREVRQRRLAQSRLLDLANTDELTGLANRRYLVFRLEDHIRTAPTPGVLLYMDLDRFKPVNDEHGHHVGDEVLKAVSERLLNTLRDQDIAARMGGDEFAVLLLDDEHAANAQGVADRIEKAINQPINVGDAIVSVGCSIGLVDLHAGMSVRDALQQADEAMYRVKMGRGRRR